MWVFSESCCYLLQCCDKKKEQAPECIEMCGPDGFPQGILTEIQFLTTYSRFVTIII